MQNGAEGQGESWRGQPAEKVSVEQFTGGFDYSVPQMNGLVIRYLHATKLLSSARP